MGKGYKMTEAHKQKIKAALKGKQNFLGKKHTKEWKNNSSKRQLGGKHPHKGYVMSDKQKEQISKSRKGSTPWNKGKTNIYSEETKKRISNSLRGKMVGDKSPNWKGGVTILVEFLRRCFEYRQWRSDVFTRDNFTCQECGDATGGNLNAHHIKYFSHILEEYKIETKEEALNCKELWNINNGITLCDICHINKHKK